MTSRRIRSVLVCTLVLLVAAPLAQAAVTPTKVLGGAGAQYDASATDDWLAYSFYDGGKTQAMAMKRATGREFRMNRAGKSGFTGGIDPGTDVAIYQEAGRGSAIYLYDMGDRTRRLAPGVNSPAWEWDARISGSYLTVFRNRVARGVEYIDLLLYRRTNPTLKRIAVFERSRHGVDGSLFLFNGSVGDRYVTWTSCAKPDFNCDVSVYDTVSRATKTVRGGGDKQEYAGVVDEANGVVYFTRSGNGCGVNVALWSLPIDRLRATPTKVAALPDGYDTGYVASIAANGDTGGTDYYFERGLCRRWNADIWVAEGVDTA